MLTKSNSLQVILIVTYLLSVTNSHPFASHRLLSVASEHQLSDLKCNTNFLKIFLLDPEIEQSESPKADLARNCPGLKHSCCSLSDFFYFNDQIKHKNNFLATIKNSMMTLSKWIIKMKDTQANKLVQMAKESKCIDTKGMSLLEARIKLIQLSDDIEQIIENSITHFSSLSSSFTCAICDVNAPNNFVKDFKEDTPITFKINQDICDAVFIQGSEVGALEFFKFIKVLNVHVKMLGCIAEDNIEMFPSYNEEELDNLEEISSKCSEQKAWLYDSKCTNLCKSFSIFNQNIFSEMMIPIEKAVNYLHEYKREMKETNEIISQSNKQNTFNQIKISLAEEENLLGKFQASAKLEIDAKKNQEYPIFKYYIEAVGGQQEYQKKVSWELVEEQGLNVTHFIMKDFQNSSTVNIWIARVLSIFIVINLF